MAATAHSRGNVIRFDGDVWRYLDGELAPGSGGKERPCVSCGLLAEIDGPDPCLGVLPGVSSACCGHGIEPGYRISNENNRR